MSRKLVAYFSASGTTRKAAKIIAKAAGADLFEIEPVVPYSRADLNWKNSDSRSSLEMQHKKFRPDLVPAVLDTTKYDTLILGFPIWWYVAPTLINSFLEKYDFAGRKIILFATSGGSGFGDTVEELQPSAPKAVFGEQKLLNRMSRKEIEAWAAGL